MVGWFRFGPNPVYSGQRGLYWIERKKVNLFLVFTKRTVHAALRIVSLLQEIFFSEEKHLTGSDHVLTKGKCLGSPP